MSSNFGGDANDGSWRVNTCAWCWTGRSSWVPSTRQIPTSYEFEFDEVPAVQMVRLEALQTTGGNTGAKQTELFGGAGAYLPF
jgi:hypothetical protein